MHCTSCAMCTGSYYHMVCLPSILFLSSLSFVLYFFLPSFLSSSPSPSCFPFFMAEHVGSSGKVSGSTQLEFWFGHRLNWLSHFVVYRAFLLKGVAPLNRPRSLLTQSFLICCERFYRVYHWTITAVDAALIHSLRMIDVSFTSSCLSFLLTGSRYID
jgi:hypothetical protein